MRQPPKRQTFEDVHGVGPVGGTRPLNDPGPNGPGTVPTRRVVDKKTGAIVIVNRDDALDDALYEDLPGGGAP